MFRSSITAIVILIISSVANSQTQKNTALMVNDKIQIEIDLYGGDIISGEAWNEEERIYYHIIGKLRHGYLIAQSGITGPDGSDTMDRRADYYTERKVNALDERVEDKITTPLTYQKGDLTYHKVFSLEKGSYEVSIRFLVTNMGDDVAEASVYSHTRMTFMNLDKTDYHSDDYIGGVYASDGTVSSYTFSDISEKNLFKAVNGHAWAGIYRLDSAVIWTSDYDNYNVVYSRAIRNVVDMGTHTPKVRIMPNETVTVGQRRLWIGPKREFETDYSNQ